MLAAPFPIVGYVAPSGAQRQSVHASDPVSPPLGVNA
jgi:hypothetical protein